METTTDQPKKSADELLAELRQETEGAEIKKNDPLFDQEEEILGKFDKENEDLGPVPEKAVSDKPEISQSKAKDMAVSWVKKFSSVQKFIYTPLYRNTILAKGDVEKMQTFREKNSGRSEKEMEDALHSDHDLWKVGNRFDKYMKAVESIPLDADEIDDLATPLAELIIKYKNLQLGPEWMLVIALGFVTLGRCAPMVPDLSKIFASDEK